MARRERWGEDVGTWVVVASGFGKRGTFGANIDNIIVRYSGFLEGKDNILLEPSSEWMAIVIFFRGVFDWSGSVRGVVVQHITCYLV